MLEWSDHVIKMDLGSSEKSPNFCGGTPARLTDANEFIIILKCDSSNKWESRSFTEKMGQSFSILQGKSSASGIALTHKSCAHMKKAAIRISPRSPWSMAYKSRTFKRASGKLKLYWPVMTWDAASDRMGSDVATPHTETRSFGIAMQMCMKLDI